MIYIGIAAAVFVVEFIIKGYIERNRETGAVTEACGGRLWIRKYHNKGAFLNIMERNGLLLKGISVVFTLLITGVFIMTLGKKGSIMLKTGLALLLGGAFSNTYDRLYRKYVVDYFSIHITKGPFKRLSQVVFNLADFCIMIGAMLTVVSFDMR